MIVNLTISFDIQKLPCRCLLYGTEGTLSRTGSHTSGMPEVTRKETVLADRTAAAEAALNRSSPGYEEELRRFHP